MSEVWNWHCILFWDYPVTVYPLCVYVCVCVCVCMCVYTSTSMCYDQTVPDISFLHTEAKIIGGFPRVSPLNPGQPWIIGAHSCWQVSALGCRSFAVLFDDINCDMCPADAKEFPSFAHAQVTVTNDVYSHLDQPDVFLFCPTGILVLYRRTMCMCVAVLCRNQT